MHTFSESGFYKTLFSLLFICDVVFFLAKLCTSALNKMSKKLKRFIINTSVSKHLNKEMMDYVFSINDVFDTADVHLFPL